MDLDLINENAMEILLHAGDARELIRKAVQFLKDDDENAFDLTMDEANGKLNKAYVIQTKVIQTTIETEKNEYSILFAHAMDTLMAIKSEYEITNNLTKLLK
ncbi:PTS lactose/cellobiose transporter subunit IIA [Paenibacillus phocaensis]|uniref:PTS lactose/cellobiose transporter subunit IIA n=1 Tax=Paenibacillus phocaensis TaxID=1776378 RepID=UPI0003A88DA9|nr:PTS lactose/cellobiose transporter subunit IIA [Paenibacillus phocaensis]